MSARAGDLQATGTREAAARTKRERAEEAARGSIVIIFLRVSLFIFAVGGLGGLIAIAAVAASATGGSRIAGLVLLALAFWVEVVLVLAAVHL